MNTTDAFFVLRNGAQAMGGEKYHERKLIGEIAISIDVTEAFNALDDTGDLTNLWLDDRLTTVAELPASGIASFEASAPKGYYENLEELIRRHRLDPPVDFRVYDLAQEDNLVPQYRQASSLARLLADLAAKRNAEGCTLVGKTELEIPFNYSVEDLCDLPKFQEMREKLTEGASSAPEDKRMLGLFRSLFIQAVHDVTAPVPKAQRFAHLLENFSDCVFRFNLAFRCFSDEANKAIERYEDKRAGMIGALNGVLGNIQTTLIGVPLAGLLALKEIKPEVGLNFPNLIIILAVLVVGSLLLALSFSQGKTLDAIGEQEKQLRDEINECGDDSKIGRLLVSMSEHHSLVHTLMKIVRWIIVVFMLVAVATMVWCIRATSSVASPPSNGSLGANKSPATTPAVSQTPPTIGVTNTTPTSSSPH